MPRISFWNGGRKSADYRFIDRNIAEYCNASGTALYVYLYKGAYGEDGEIKPITEVQDMLLQENRDRAYDTNIRELRGLYNVQDNDFDLRQFGFFMSNDTLFLEVHLSDMIEICGRKIMPGDVIELPHQRDDALLDESGAINRFYVVEDGSRASSGYSVTWLPHLWRIKVSPMTGAQEYQDILDQAAKDPFGLDTDSTLSDILTNYDKEMAINEAVLDEAKTHLFARNFETQHFYFVPGDETGDQLPWIWAGDGIPPNGAELVGSGDSFPEGSQDGDYFLKTNMTPHQLYRKKGSMWLLQELDYRMGKWSAAHRILDSFLNERGITVHEDGSQSLTKVALSKAARPRPDF